MPARLQRGMSQRGTFIKWGSLYSQTPLKITIFSVKAPKTPAITKQRGSLSIGNNRCLKNAMAIKIKVNKTVFCQRKKTAIGAKVANNRE